MTQQGMYASIIAHIFRSKFQTGMREVEFERQDIIRSSGDLGLEQPKNLGDLIYSFRYRATMPEAIQSEAGEGEIWIIRPAGRSRYRFVLVADRPLIPNENMVVTKVPDATPGVIAKYSLTDEQALLARVRYNRLVDIFTGVTCYSLQNHLRTTAPGMGQVETDEIYVGVDRQGVHYVFPVQAKGGSDRMNAVQIEQDLAVCADKFPGLICRPIGAQFMEDEVIALLEFAESESQIGVASEKHYRLVAPDQVTDADLRHYRRGHSS